MERASAALGAQGIATFRYQFPYVEKGRRTPDPQPILLSTVRAAVAEAHASAGDLPLLAGGKSMGGRMTSLASAAEALPGVRGLVFFGFPLHPMGRPDTVRSDHLDRVDVPMLFLQGTKDKLANVELLQPLIERLGGNATLHIIEDADHSFATPKRSGRDLDDVLFELARTTAAWADCLFGGGHPGRPAP